MEKTTIIINGTGGCGKDTLITFVSKYYKVKNVSSIDPAKIVANICGWNGVKDEKYRKFLSSIKQLMIDFNDYPTNYILNLQEEFLSSDDEIMFVHIREAEEIEKLKNKSFGKTITLLITPRAELKGVVYGNPSDDEVENYDYDYTYNNVLPIEEVEADFIEFFNKII